MCLSCVLNVLVPQIENELVVEVSKIVSHPMFSAAFLEQIADIPVLGWCRGAELQSSLPEQSSTAPTTGFYCL